MIIGHFRFRREGYAGWKSDDQHPFPKSATASSARARSPLSGRGWPIVLRE